MDQFSLQQLIDRKKVISIVYRREKDEMLKNYTLDVVEIKTEFLKDGSREIYLYATKLPKVVRNKIQKFILKRIMSAF